MEIKTKEYQISPRDIFIGYLRHHARLLFPFMMGLYLFGCYRWAKGGHNLTTWTIIMISIQLYQVVYFWWYARKACTGINALKLTLELKDGYIFQRYSDGSEVKLGINNIKKILQAGKFYMLYLSRLSFIMVPKSVFISEEDREAFISILREKPKPE